MNLFSICLLNNPEIEIQFQTYVNPLQPTEKNILKKFGDKILNHGQIGINMKPMVLLDFLISKRYLNIYEWVDHISKRASISKNKILEDKLDSYYKKRIAFDQYFDRGKEFNYGTLNIGGLGAIRYGEYYVILEKAKLKNSGELGFLESDSLRTYITPTLSVNDADLRKHCATDTHVHLLATLKHATDILRLQESEWASLLCNNDDYVEAIFDTKILPEQILTVRFPKLDYDLYWEYAFNEHRDKVSELDRYRVDTFSKIDEYLTNLGVNWENV